MPAPVVVSLWPGAAPGTEGVTYSEKETPLPGSQMMMTRNVVVPTLTVHLPDASVATGAGMIVAPGGGFRFLSMAAEGHDVARWLTDRGIAAFVLKYRTIETPVNDMELWAEIQAVLGGGGKNPFRPAQDGLPGIADGKRAMEVVRERAAEWGISPNNIGFIGFSAGAMVAAHVALELPAPLRPAFVAPIYGGPLADLPEIPKGLPPFFIAYSSDDPLVPDPVLKFYAALRATGQHPELHVYRDGGHGYGMNKQGKSSDFWTEDFYNWLTSIGVSKRVAPR